MALDAYSSTSADDPVNRRHSLAAQTSVRRGCINMRLPGSPTHSHEPSLRRCAWPLGGADTLDGVLRLHLCRLTLRPARPGDRIERSRAGYLTGTISLIRRTARLCALATD